ncbi:MAG: D-aminoacyl-tRNA deacylase [Phycisphaeraceae bacterium]
MRVLLQRVSSGSVTVAGKCIGQIGKGYVLLVGIGEADSEREADWLAEKVVNLRLFPNEAGQFDRSLLEVNGGALVISQFTLYGDARKGRRPSFVRAARPEVAEPLCDYFAGRLKELGVTVVATGRFGADMQVSLINDGPVTLMLERNPTD